MAGFKVGSTITRFLGVGNIGCRGSGSQFKCKG